MEAASVSWRCWSVYCACVCAVLLRCERFKPSQRKFEIKSRRSLWEEIKLIQTQQWQERRGHCQVRRAVLMSWLKNTDGRRAAEGGWDKLLCIFTFFSLKNKEEQTPEANENSAAVFETEPTQLWCRGYIHVMITSIQCCNSTVKIVCTFKGKLMFSSVPVDTQHCCGLHQAHRNINVSYIRVHKQIKSFSDVLSPQ